MKTINYVEALFLVCLAIAIVLGIWVTITGCHDGCDPDETRCHKNKVEICDHDDDWGLVLDCDQLEPYDGEICCWDVELEAHNCLPPALCDAPDGGAL